MTMEEQLFEQNTPPPAPPHHQEMNHRYWHYRPAPPSGIPPAPPPPPPPRSHSPYSPSAYDYHQRFHACEGEDGVMEQHQQQQLHPSNSWNSGSGSFKRRDHDRQRRMLRHRQQQLHHQNMLRPRMNDVHSPSSAAGGQHYYDNGESASSPYNESPYYNHRPRWETHPQLDEQSPEDHHSRQHHSPKLDNGLRAAESFDESLYAPVPYEEIHPSSSAASGEYYPEAGIPEEDGINFISPSRPGKQSPSALFDFSKRYPPSSPVHAVLIDSFDSYHDEHAFLPPPSSCRSLTEKKHITPDKTKLTPSSSPLPVPPSNSPVAQDMAHVNNNDVLCGRGGGTNSQVGNRRFRQLVQDHQPQYLTARRKEKPQIARQIVRLIRQRGGRFLKRDDNTEHLFEVGDDKAEAKTSQALREGLDVRATKGAAHLLSKKDDLPISRSCSFATPDRTLIVKQSQDHNKRKPSEISASELNEDDRKLFLDFSPPRASKMVKSDHKTITPCRSYDSQSKNSEQSYGEEEEYCSSKDASSIM